MVAFRAVAFRAVPFRAVAFRTAPFRAGTFHIKPFRVDPCVMVMKDGVISSVDLGWDFLLRGLTKIFQD